MTEQDPGADVARQLLALAREELELIEHGRDDDLAAVDERREALTAQLPARLSAQARTLLLDVVEEQRQVAAALQLGMARVREQMGRVRHGRTAMNGYTPAGMDARPVLDASA